LIVGWLVCLFVGRFGGSAQPRYSRTWTASLAVLRLALVPLLMLCNAQPRRRLPVLIASDAGFTGVMAALALTSGYVSNLCFIRAPAAVPRDDQEAASSLVAAALGIGLAVGGVLSAPLVHLL